MRPASAHPGKPLLLLCLGKRPSPTAPHRTDREHKALLWESFLADGQQPLEFAWLWEIYYTDQTRWLLEWELALDMVLDQLSFQVNRDTNSFCLLDGTGRERRFDFTRGGPAEKLFLKLLFPLDTR